MFAKVLFTIDQSRESLETTTKAIDLATKHNSQITIISVLQLDNPEMGDFASVKSLLQKAKDLVERAGVKCDVIERQGNPAFVICDVADELNVDLIIMGTRGINLEKNIESTAARVIQLAPCPVLVVP